MIKELLEATKIEIDYTFKRLALGTGPGNHISNAAGAGLEFKSLDSVANFPDLRRIDWIRTAQGEWDPPLVKIFEEQKSIEVIAVVDLSASMGFEGKIHKIKEVAKLISALAYSVYRNGDQFGFMAYDHEVISSFYFPSILSKDIGFEIGEILWQYDPKGRGHEGLRIIPDYLPTHPCLIFWISDTYTDPEILKHFLSSTTQHELITIIMNDEKEYDLPNWGFIKIFDPEKNLERFLFLNPKLVKKIKQKFNDLKMEFKKLLENFQREYIELSKFDALKINRFFEEVA